MAEMRTQRNFRFPPEVDSLLVKLADTCFAGNMTDAFEYCLRFAAGGLIDDVPPQRRRRSSRPRVSTKKDLFAGEPASPDLTPPAIRPTSRRATKG